MNTITIFFDAAFDLSQAGYNRSEARDFGAAWRGALDAIVEEAGLEVRVTSQGGEGEVSELVRDLWQGAHDVCSRPGDEPGDLWRYHEEAARATGRKIKVAIERGRYTDD